MGISVVRLGHNFGDRVNLAQLNALAYKGLSMLRDLWTRSHVVRRSLGINKRLEWISVRRIGYQLGWSSSDIVKRN